MYKKKRKNSCFQKNNIFELPHSKNAADKIKIEYTRKAHTQAHIETQTYRHTHINTPSLNM